MIEGFIRALVEEDYAQNGLEDNLGESHTHVQGVPERAYQTSLGNVVDLADEGQVTLVGVLDERAIDSWLHVQWHLGVVTLEVLDKLSKLLLGLVIGDMNSPFEVLHLYTFLVHGLHVEISRVGMGRHWEADVLEVVHGLFGVSLIDDPPLHHNDEPVKLSEYLRGRLMYC